MTRSIVAVVETSLTAHALKPLHTGSMNMPITTWQIQHIAAWHMNQCVTRQVVPTLHWLHGVQHSRDTGQTRFTTVRESVGETGPESTWLPQVAKKPSTSKGNSQTWVQPAHVTRPLARGTMALHRCDEDVIHTRSKARPRTCSAIRGGGVREVLF